MDYKEYISRFDKLEFVSLEGLPGLRISSSGSLGEGDFMVTLLPVTAPVVMIKTPHTHEFDQILSVIGSDPNNILDLGGEVEFTICEPGGKPERLSFTSAVSINVPRGTIHGPVIFVRVDDPTRPIWFQDIIKTAEYSRTETEEICAPLETSG